MKKIITLLLTLIFSNINAITLFINEESVSIRKSPSMDSEILEIGKLFDQYEIISQSKVDSIIEKKYWFKDNWYFIKTKNGKTGYIFGHFTSLKKDGQLSYIMKLEELNWEDGQFHFIFTENTDFGKGRNELGRYGSLIIEDSHRKNPYLIGRKFDITFNYLKSEVNSEVKEVLTIVEFLPIKD